MERSYSETTPTVILMRLARESDDFRVGCVLAKNRNLPATSFAALASKDYPDMRPRTEWESGTKYRGQVGVCLAQSDLTPDDVLQTLLQNSYKDVRQAAKTAIRKRG